MRTRAERRSQKARYKNVAIRKVKEDFRYSPEHLQDMNNHDMQVRVGRQANTRTLCSCWMCRSQRKFYGNSKNALTMQETRAIMRATDEDGSE